MKSVKCLCALGAMILCGCGSRVGEECGGEDATLCGLGEFCRFDEGTCGDNQEIGICEAKPLICTREFAPVCGCDGVTYGNDCDAAGAGVSIAHFDECADTVCTSTEECGSGSFCEFEIGVCGEGDQTGVCTALPDVCADIFQPVCGCDGSTYSNACTAEVAGVSVAHQGECETEPQPCSASDESSCGEQEYCQFENGNCAAGDQLGICTAIPADCNEDKEIDVVCGCDGVTYDTACEAAMAGVSLAEESDCAIEPQVCGGIAGLPCDDREYCQFDKDTCDISDNQGVCTDIPEFCANILEPVCGCDGRIYRNRCSAQMAEISLANDTECDLERACVLHTDCAQGQLCIFEIGVCALDEVTAGSCFDPTLVECADADDLVCGCDGATYRNECQASLAGVSVASKGACSEARCCDVSEQPGVGGNLTCIEGASCCADGLWQCNNGNGTSSCEEAGEVCPSVSGP